LHQLLNAGQQEGSSLATASLGTGLRVRN
jgi:hypothetical protein